MAAGQKSGSGSDDQESPVTDEALEAVGGAVGAAGAAGGGRARAAADVTLQDLGIVRDTAIIVQLL